jgi:hypothetical protein
LVKSSLWKRYSHHHYLVNRYGLSVSLTVVPRENHRPVASHWQKLCHTMLLRIHLSMCEIRTHNVSLIGDRGRKIYVKGKRSIAIWEVDISQRSSSSWWRPSRWYCISIRLSQDSNTLYLKVFCHLQTDDAGCYWQIDFVSKVVPLLSR